MTKWKFLKCCSGACVRKEKEKEGWLPKNFVILKILVSIHSKHNMGMTNINFVFHQIPPCEQERGGKHQKNEN